MWLLTLTAALVPAAFGIYQVWVFFDEAFPHLYWSRTLPALAGVVLTAAVLVLPLWVALSRRRFGRWTRSGRWTAFAVTLAIGGLLYLVPFVKLSDAARHSRAIIPYTPVVTLIGSPDDSARPVTFGVAGGPGTGYGGSRSQGDRHLTEWTAPLEPRSLTSPSDHSDPPPAVSLRAEALRETGSFTVEVEIDTPQTVIFRVRGLDASSAFQAGAPATLPLELSPGSHTVTIKAALPPHSAPRDGPSES